MKLQFRFPILAIALSSVAAFGPRSVPNQQPQKLTLDAATALPIDASVPLAREEQESKVGVLMLNLGGPETGDDVEGT